MKKKAVSFRDMRSNYKTRPKKTFLWNGIKEKSFGLIFGPPKSGKTILCENLAINIAIGSSSYLDYKLIGKPEKVLFVGLEEFWEERVERNLKQFEGLDHKEQELMNENYFFQPIDFSKKIVKKEHWLSLIECIKESEAKIVFIDSITRMNHGNLEDSKTAEEIMQKLRNMCYELGITLICIHHTPKLNGKAIFMDSIKGSSTFSAESDFAIGVNRTTKKFRYMKNVFFRYASDKDDMVKEFEINEDTSISYISDIDEDELLARSDRRRTDDKREKLLSFFSSQPSITFTKKELIQKLPTILDVKTRMAEYYLKDAVDKNLIDGSKTGFYKFINK